ncbi:hypothetical protein [Maribacter luteus]|uniref:hypothetical protein n=1 Tax=Maribacter luteus TaxID=2594478 RepID=UPI002491B972|nr:hypothetical protein [Maribacter luteus]
MVELLENCSGFIYEQENSFEPNTVPCYYFKKDTGYVVYFLLKGGVIDFGVYNNRKELISLITNIDQSIDDKWKDQFVERSILDTELRKLKMYR